MRKVRFTEEQMVAIIREADREPVSAVANGTVSASRRSTLVQMLQRFGGFRQTTCVA